MLKLVCIPAFDEEKTIANVVKASMKYADKVIVCDDASIDKTFDVAKKAGAIVIKHEKNIGKGGALKTLFEYSKKLNADIIITIDGDGQSLPEEIPKLVKPILEKKFDVVIGYRFDNAREMPIYRKFGNKALDKITNIATGASFRDTQSGFRAYSKKAIKEIKFNSNGFGADVEILVDAAKRGLRITEEKVSVIYNTGSKTSTKNPISHSTTVILSLIEIISIRHPLKFLGIPGLILMIIGIVFSMVVLSIFNETRYFSVPSTLIALGSFILGLLLLLMSVVLFSIDKHMKQM